MLASVNTPFWCNRTSLQVGSFRGIQWSWRESNPRPNIIVKSFLHAYFIIGPVSNYEVSINQEMNKPNLCLAACS